MAARRLILILIPLAIIGGLSFWFWHESHSQEEAVDTPADGFVTLPQYEEPSDAIDGNAPDEEAGSIVEQPEPQPVDTADEANADVEETTASAPTATETEVLKAAHSASTAPLWLTLLGLETPMRRAVQVIDCIANGERPLEPLGFLRPKDRFTAGQSDDGRVVVSTAAIARYSAVITLLEQADAAKLAALYRQAEPLLQKSCNDLGYQDMPVRKLLIQACDTILSIPDFDFEPTLVKRAEGLYAYDDVTFETLNDAQKLFIRLGSANCSRLKRLCSDFADELQLYSE